MTTGNEDSQFSQAEIDSAVASVLSEEDLRQRSQSLHDCQELWEKTAYLAEAKMPCRECGATGRVGREICPGCMGARVELAPDAEEFPMPDFATMRKAIGAYGDAVADRELPSGHKGKRFLALPPASTVPTLEAIAELATEGKAKLKELRQLTAGAPAGRGTDARELPEGKPPSGFEGDGDLGDVDDAELDEIEDAVIKADNAKPPRGGRR